MSNNHQNSKKQNSTEVHEPKRLIDEVVIRHPRHRRLLKLVKELVEENDDLNEKMCFALGGPSGVGKSTWARDCASFYPRRKTEKGWIIPLVYLELPSPATPNSVVTELLSAYEDPYAQKGTETNKTLRLREYIKEFQTKIIILDEFHHLFDSKTKRVFEQVSEWLKTLIKKSQVIVIVIGMEELIDAILDSNPQLSRLFAERETLRPFEWDSVNEQARKVFGDFVRTVEIEIVTLPLSKELERAELLHRIWYATRGKPANIIKLLRSAARWSQRQGLSHITLKALSRAFIRRLAKDVRVPRNPFDEKWGKHFVPPKQKTAKAKVNGAAA